METATETNQKYQASAELVDILLKHGFVENTQRHYPDHFSRQKNGYDPHHMKRNFAFPGTRHKVLFDYINIRLSSSIQTYGLTGEQLTALITYFKISSADRNKMDEEGYGILGAREIHHSHQKHPELYDKSYQKRILATFNSISLN